MVSATESLPMAENINAPAVDLIVFTLFMSQRHSLDLFTRNLQAMGEERDHYVRGKWVCFCTGVSRPSTNTCQTQALVIFDAEHDGTFSFPLDHAESLAGQNLMPIVYATSENPQSLEHTAARICGMLRQASRVNAVSPMFSMNL